MAEYDKERVLRGNTVEDQDRSKIEAVITDLDQYRRERHGLPSKPITVEGEIIHYKPVTEDIGSNVDPKRPIFTEHFSGYQIFKIDLNKVNYPLANRSHDKKEKAA